MKSTIAALLMSVVLLAGFNSASAQPEPTVYLIKKGDTLWGLSGRFINDPGYWPNLWAHNPVITNPHLIFPGQRVKVYADRIEVEQVAPVEQVEQPKPVPPVEEVVPERMFTVRKGSGTLLEQEIPPVGRIIATYQNRKLVGENDVVYTDIGRQQGAKAGDRFLISKSIGPVKHPKKNFILGYKSIPLGVLELKELDAKTSKAVITNSLMEIGAGVNLMPYREGIREVALKEASRELSGFIVDTQTGDKIVAADDIVFLDLGAADGIEMGNMLYVCREIELDQRYRDKFEKVPKEVLGALVVVERGAKTSTALIIKSVDTIYVGDQVELKKSR